MVRQLGYSVLVMVFLCPFFLTGQETVTDIDGNIYQTVQIGEQEWMAENLRVTRYRNGDVILSNQPFTFWQQSTEGIWTWMDNDASNDVMYGKLYNWYATVDVRGLCPQGWKVPSDGDWQQLVSFADPVHWGNNNTLGTKLKSRRQVNSPLGASWSTIEHPRWDNHGNRFGTDDYGFGALPGGGTTMGNAWIHKGKQAYFWSKSPWTDKTAWARTILFSHRGMSRSAYQKQLGFSVRCIKGEDVFNLIVSVEPPGIGGIASDGGQFASGNEINLTATPNSGYTFSHWAQNGDTISTDASFTFTMPATDVVLVAHFIKLKTMGDTEFWFAVPKVTEGHDWGNRRFYFRLANTDFPNTITISMPANPSFIPIVAHIAAGDVNTVDITDIIFQIWNEFPNEIYNRAIKIEATHPAYALFEVGIPNNPEIFTLKGRNALGLEFFVPFQDHFNNGNYTPRPYSGIYIAATQDNTTVTITPTRPVFPDRPAGVPFTIVLNKGESYAVAPDNYYEAAGQLAANHLGGTKVESTKPIALTTSDDSVAANPYGGCRDLVGDQIVPTNHIGTEYIAMRGRLGHGGSPTMPEFVFILATQPDTQVYIDGELKTVLQPGQQYRWAFTALVHHIKSSQPCYVYHVTGFGCEMAGAILPPVDGCNGSTNIHFIRSKGERFFLNILVRAGAEDGFILNGDGPNTIIKASDFSIVPGNTNWLAAEFELSQAQVPVGIGNQLENVKGLFHVGIINGGASTGTMYGYFSDYQRCNEEY